VPPELPENHPVHWPTSLSPNPPPGPTSGAPKRPPIILSSTKFQPTTELPKTDIAMIVELPPLPEISYTNYDANDDSTDSSDLGSAEDTPIISHKQTEYSVMQFLKQMGQANYSAFTKW
jgi:hypothetical protein